MKSLIAGATLCLAVLFADSTLKAESCVIRVHVKLTEDASVYSQVPSDPALAAEGWLEQTDASFKGLVEMSMKVTGEDEQRTRNEIRTTEVPGKNGNQGYARARLRQIGGRVELVLDALELKNEPVKDTQGKDTGKTRETQKAKKDNIDLEFAPKGGTWRDYEEGKTVELRFTKAAIDHLLQKVKLEANSSAYVEAPSSGNATIKIKVDRAKVPGRKASDFGRVTASKRRIDLIQIPTDTEIYLKASN